MPDIIIRSNGDWVPRGRSDLLDMARAWMRFLTLNGARIGVPSEYIAELQDFIIALEALLDQSSAGERTKSMTAKINMAAHNLEKHLRYGKKHWIIMPPVTLDEWLSMLLPAPDEVRTEVPAPDKAAAFEAASGSVGLAQIFNIHVSGAASVNKSQYKEGIIAYGLTGLPTADRPFRFDKEPASPAVLPHFEITKRRAHTLVLTGERGNAVYIAIRYRSSNGKLGPWSAIIKVIIP